jgi:hypothetical protein
MKRSFVLTRLALVLVANAQSAAAAPAKPAPAPKSGAKKGPKLPAAPAPTAAVAPPSVDPVTGKVFQPRPAFVEVTVVEIAGEHAYLTPGAAAGVRRGAIVRLNNVDYTVSGTTAAYAMIDVGNAPLKEKAKGQIVPSDEPEEKAKELPKPTPLANFTGQWSVPVKPSDSQHPKPVPLGRLARDRRYDFMLFGTLGSTVPFGRGNPFFRSEVGVRVHAEPLPALSFDVDAAVQKWFGPGVDERAGRDARTLVRVRELQVGVGRPASWFGAVGRLRYASATLGALDGLRLRAPLGSSASVSAFGGFVPHPLTGLPSAASQRFGAELNYVGDRSTLRPEAAVVAHGSTYDGKLDERRLAALVAVYPGQSRIGAHAEASLFDPSNAWGLKPFELTALGVDASLRAKAFQFGARVDMHQQERSRFIASFFPASWLCVTAPAPAPAPGAAPVADTCADARANTYYSASADAGLTTERFALTLGATVLKNPLRGAAAASQMGAFVNARVLRIFKKLRLDSGASYSSGTYLNLLNWTAGPGATLLHERLDVSLYYRQSFLTYAATSASPSLLNHTVGASLNYLPTPQLVFAAQGEGFVGGDTGAAILYLTTIWRPGF